MKKMTRVILVLLAILAIVVIHLQKRNADPVFSKDPTASTGSVTTEATQETAPETTEPAPTWNTYPQDRQLLAKDYFVYDCNTDAFLVLSTDASERIYPASITKLFTAYVAMQYIDPQMEIVAGDALDFVAWGSSVAKIQKGDVLTAEQLVEAMLLPSGNDAAYLLACEAGRIIQGNPNLNAATAIQIFLEQMNLQAQEMGMAGTQFINPDGIHDSNHYTTFQDLAILGKLSMADETIMKYAVTPSQEVSLHGEVIQWKNTNALIDPNSQYYCPYAIGLKTGQTPSAGSCLLSAFRINGQELLIGVFGCPGEKDRFDDTLQLFNQIVLE